MGRFIFIMLWVLPLGVWGQNVISIVLPKYDTTVTKHKIKKETIIEKGGLSKTTKKYDKLGRLKKEEYKQYPVRFSYQTIETLEYSQLNDSGTYYSIDHYIRGS